jgi:uncharacterized protein (TIGR02246 family)
MADVTEREAVVAAMAAINRAWLDGRPEDLSPRLHPDVTMVVPGFVARVQGRETFLAGFVDFCSQATVHEYREEDLKVDIAADTAVVSYRYEMVYERAGERFRADGRDLWVFARGDGQWVAVWRTMLDSNEQPA